MGENRKRRKRRKYRKGLKADYRGATPEQVAAALMAYRPGVGAVPARRVKENP